MVVAIAFLAVALPRMSEPSVPADELSPVEATVASVHAALAASQAHVRATGGVLSRADRPRPISKVPR